MSYKPRTQHFQQRGAATGTTIFNTKQPVSTENQPHFCSVIFPAGCSYACSPGKRPYKFVTFQVPLPSLSDFSFLQIDVDGSLGNPRAGLAG